MYVRPCLIRDFHVDLFPSWLDAVSFQPVFRYFLSAFEVLRQAYLHYCIAVVEQGCLDGNDAGYYPSLMYIFDDLVFLIGDTAMF